MKTRPLAPLELLLAALSLWAAWYHTPAGALLRTAGAWFFKTHSTARPLLAYYGAGVYAPRVAPPPLLAAPVPPAQALGYGAWATFSEERAGHGTPAAISAQIKSLSARLGSSDEAAMLALFCGEEQARYAVSRADTDARLEDLARQLPPRSADCIAQASQALAQSLNQTVIIPAWRKNRIRVARVDDQEIGTAQSLGVHLALQQRVRADHVQVHARLQQRPLEHRLPRGGPRPPEARRAEAIGNRSGIGGPSRL